jgi:hypothetical protein
VLLKRIDVKFPATTFRTFSELDFLLFFSNWSFGRLGDWSLDLRITCFFFCHLPLKNRHEVLVAFDGNLLSFIYVLLSLNWSFDRPIIKSLRRNRRRFFIDIFLFSPILSNFWIGLSNLLLALISLFPFFLKVSLFSKVGFLLPFLHRSIPLIFIPTHPISAHLLLEQLQTLLRLMYFAIGHILLYFVVDLLGRT